MSELREEIARICNEEFFSPGDDFAERAADRILSLPSLRQAADRLSRMEEALREIDYLDMWGSLGDRARSALSSLEGGGHKPCAKLDSAPDKERPCEVTGPSLVLRFPDASAAFVNEYGNHIEIDAKRRFAATSLYAFDHLHIEIRGPTSRSTNDLTAREAERLRDVLIAALSTAEELWGAAPSLRGAGDAELPATRGGEA